MNIAEITPLHTPVIASELSSDWISAMRAMLDDQKIELRAVGLHIEAINRQARGQWQRLSLPPHGWHEFATAQDRDLVFDALANAK